MLLIIGGLLWFLPILGIEMLPIGIVLIALDVPFLRGPAARMLAWIERGVVWAIALWQSVSAAAARQRDPVIAVTSRRTCTSPARTCRSVRW